MKIKQLHLQNFRGIADLNFEFHERLSVLVGVNGAGKSSILDASAILLSRLTSTISTSKAGGRLFAQEDIRNGADVAKVWLQVEFDGQMFDWSMTKTRAGRPHEASSDLGGTKELAQRVRPRARLDSQPDNIGRSYGHDQEH